MLSIGAAFILFGLAVTGLGAVFAVSTAVALHEGWAQRRQRAPRVLAWSALVIYLGAVMLITGASR